jgi:hypothetical protein
MAKFTMTHDLDCDPDKFWQLFLHEKEFNQKLFKELEFPEWELLEQTEGDKEIKRVVKAVPKMDMPSAVAKLLGDRFGYTERGTFDKTAKTYKFAIEASTMKDKLKNEGFVRCEPAGEGKSRRIVDITAEAKVFGIGGMIESSFEKSYRTGWGHSAAFINRWVKEHP